MHNYIIRQAIEADQAVIRKMVSDARLDTTTLKWQNFLIAEQEGQIIGIGQIKPYHDCQELGSLVVQKPYRKSGVGGALIAALEARAGRPLYLLCASRMQPYYERFGYQIISWWEAPSTLKLKLSAAALFRIFGIRVLVMRKG